MSALDAVSPKNEDQQIGFDNAFRVITAYWNAVTVQYGDDKAGAFDHMDSFMLGVMVKLTGGSNYDAMQTMDFVRDVNDAGNSH